jgi:hypothetical protein
MERKLRYPLYMPEELRERLTAEAKQADRSLHAEILRRLRESIRQSDQPDQEAAAA